MSEIPEKIFLNVGPLSLPAVESLGPLSWGDITWSDEKKDKHDIEYIRYDLYRKRERELTDQIKYLIVENSTLPERE